ncbi:hypothetical protein AAHN93_09565 [Vandammella animalimorsus]
MHVLSRIRAVQAKLVEALGDGYGGSWIGRDPDGRVHLVVAVTHLQAGQRVGDLGHDIHWVLVPRSLQHLQQLQERLVQKYFRSGKGAGLIASIGVGEVENKVLVRGTRANFNAIAQLLQADGFDLADIELQEQNGSVIWPEQQWAIQPGADLGNERP